jgi:hypothetical protein
VFGCATIEVTVTVIAEAGGAGGAGLGCPASEVTVIVMTDAGGPIPCAVGQVSMVWVTFLVTVTVWIC